MIINNEKYQYHRVRYNLYLKFASVKTQYWYKLFLGSLGRGCIIMNPLFISFNRVYLGRNITIRNNSRIEAVVCYNKSYFNPRIIIGDDVSIEQNLHLTCGTKISIGNKTSISANVTITDIHHPYDIIDIPIEKQDIECKEVSIGSDCKIYNNAVILPGTIIGHHCTIGANSVVNGVYPDNCVIVGAPARIVKQYSSELKKWIKIDIK